MAVSADRGELVAARDGLPVNALHEGVCDVGVALAAGGGNVELGDGRFGVVGGENFVRAVAIGADRGLLRSIGDGAAVHAVLVGEEGLRAFAVRLHEKLLPVAPAAGGGNIGVIDGRLGIARALNLVNVAVAVLATGGNLSALVHFRVDAVLIRLAGIGVALRAADFLRGRLVRQALHILVAIHAGEHAAVDGMLELALVDEEADRRSVLVRGGERGVGVAGEAVRVLELLRGVCGRGPGKKKENERANEKTSCNVHTLRRCLCEKSCRDSCHSHAMPGVTSGRSSVVTGSHKAACGL